MPPFDAAGGVRRKVAALQVRLAITRHIRQSEIALVRHSETVDFSLAPPLGCLLMRRSSPGASSIVAQSTIVARLTGAIVNLASDAASTTRSKQRFLRLCLCGGDPECEICDASRVRGESAGTPTSLSPAAGMVQRVPQLGFENLPMLCDLIRTHCAPWIKFVHFGCVAFDENMSTIVRDLVISQLISH